MKPFNDGLYAAVEIGVQEGMIDDVGESIYPSKKQFLHDLLQELLAVRDAAGGDTNHPF